MTNELIELGDCAPISEASIYVDSWTEQYIFRKGKLRVTLSRPEYEMVEQLILKRRTPHESDKALPADVVEAVGDTIAEACAKQPFKDTDFYGVARKALAALPQSEAKPEFDLAKDSVRCMSIVFDEIAALVELPKEQYGDPDALMDAIEALKDKAAAGYLAKQEVGEDEGTETMAVGIMESVYTNYGDAPEVAYARAVEHKLNAINHAKAAYLALKEAGLKIVRVK